MTDLPPRQEPLKPRWPLILGGLVGVMLGWAIGHVINLGTNIYLKRQDLPGVNISSVPWWLIAGAIGFAVLISLIAGLFFALVEVRNFGMVINYGLNKVRFPAPLKEGQRYRLNQVAIVEAFKGGWVQLTADQQPFQQAAPWRLTLSGPGSVRPRARSEPGEAHFAPHRTSFG